MNRSSDSWAAQVRRAWIERSAQRRGFIQRQHIVEAFGISSAQSSADLQALLKEHPRCLEYDLNVKAYQWRGKKLVTKVPYPIANFRR